MEARSKYNLIQGQSDMLNMRIDPKVKFLVEIAARESGRNLSGFVELALRKALIEGLDREATPGLTPVPMGPMMYEELWDDDPDERFCNLATTFPQALTPRARKAWEGISKAATVKGKLKYSKALQLAKEWRTGSNGDQQ